VLVVINLIVGAKMITWKKLFTEALAENGESFSDVISASITDAEFDVDLHGPNGGDLRMKEFAVYTGLRVYYPIESMDSDWLFVGSQSRNPITLP